MFVVSNFILAIARLLEILLEVYFWIIVVRALISWVNPDPCNPIVRFLYQVTEPVLRPIRRRLPPWQTGTRPLPADRHLRDQVPPVVPGGLAARLWP